MKMIFSALAIAGVTLLSGCADVENADEIQQEQLQRSMTAPGQQTLVPPPGDPEPKREPVPGEELNPR